MLLRVLTRLFAGQREEYPLPLNAFMHLYDNHTIYVFTWYSLTAILLYIMAQYSRRRPPRRGPLLANVGK